MFDFNDKVVLITGGSRGLGKAMSCGFARAGAKVIVASRKLDGCQAVVDSIVAEGGEAWACAVNTSSTDDLDRLVGSSLEHYGHVDILINNAGTNIAQGPLTDVTAAAFDKMYQINQRGPWYLASRLAPHMADNGEVVRHHHIGQATVARYNPMIASNFARGFAVDCGDHAAQHWCAFNFAHRRITVQPVIEPVHLVLLDINKEIGWRDFG